MSFYPKFQIAFIQKRLDKFFSNSGFKVSLYQIKKLSRPNPMDFFLFQGTTVARCALERQKRICRERNLRAKLFLLDTWRSQARLKDSKNILLEILAVRVWKGCTGLHSQFGLIRTDSGQIGCAAQNCSSMLLQVGLQAKYFWNPWIILVNTM